MKKVMVFVLGIFLLSLALVLAEQNGNNTTTTPTDDDSNMTQSNTTTAPTDDSNETITSSNRTLTRQQIINKAREQIREHRNEFKNESKQIKAQIRERKEDIVELRQTFLQRLRNRNKAIKTTIQNKRIEFEALKDGIRLRVENKTQARTRLNISEDLDENNESILVVEKNGQRRQIKIMPDTASERALERLRLKVCSEENNCTVELKDVGQRNETIAYEVRVEKHSRLFGIFKKKMQVTAQVDAETGEVIQAKKPWWAFLASESEE